MNPKKYPTIFTKKNEAMQWFDLLSREGYIVSLFEHEMGYLLIVK